ncbi:glycosyltransferase family 2 protein [Brevibacillus daliensis]|uniref:glycosyltransferase family 2 protein n=1 Tax=Brevibacillus daliensis TaxID=2892995 RepID=UPI001E2D0993|nr:glycosyltransferase family 2 protein [Brevibacillus daliensis]
MTKELVLGVHLLVRDEEELLPHCLRSIVMIADEIIIIDTGSTDKTVEIAKAFGAKVIATEWQDDFAQARNVGLQHATTKWVFYIDADEEVLTGEAEIRHFLEKTTADRCMVHVTNRVGERPEEKIEHGLIRIFRTDKGFRFQGRIHEQLLSDQEMISEIPVSPLRLNHDGYLPSLMKRKEKVNRNMHILTQCLQDSPTDPFILYNLAVTHCQRGEYQQAVDKCAESFRNIDFQAPYRPTLLRDWAKILLKLGQSNQVVHLLQNEVQHYRNYADLHVLLAQALEEQGFLLGAFASYEQASGCKAEAGNSYVCEAGMNSYRPYTAMGRLAQQKGELQVARHLFEHALKLHPRYEPALISWADYLQETGASDSEIAEQLMGLVQPEQPEDTCMTIHALLHIGAFSTALFILDEHMLHTPKYTNLQLICLIQTGQLSVSVALIKKMIAAFPEENRQTLLIDWALCSWSEQRILPYTFYEAMEVEQKIMIRSIENWVLEEKGVQQTTDNKATIDFIQIIMERAVEYRLLRLAKRLSEWNSCLLIPYAKALYQEGHILLSADILLDLLEQQQLDAEGHLYLGEILYLKGFYAQASTMFEGVISLASDNWKARMGAAASYLHLAREVAFDTITAHPEAEIVRQDLQKLEASLKAMGGISWQMKQQGRRRRNIRAE